MSACFFVLAFLFAAVFALTLQEFKASYFYANESVTFKALKAQGAYSLVLFNGSEVGIFDSENGSLVMDKAKIASILREDEYARADFEGTKTQASQFWSLYYMSKKGGEGTCNQYFGLDNYNCTDKVSCIRSCMSVPLCQPLVYVAGFVEGMQKWAKDRDSVDALVDEFNVGIVGAFSSAQGMQEKGEQLEGIIAQAAKVKNSGIFWDHTDAQCKSKTCFAFCPKPDYGEKEAEELAGKMLVVKSAIEGEGARVQRANEMQTKSEWLQERSKEVGKQQPQPQEGKSAGCIPMLAISGLAATVFILYQRKQ
ncbi:Uncharacterised protein [Candidatus Anstonella stagnisolia]|nr:Uncharacterised protein [Candidatus Anstonella stagnisolia]